MPPGKRRNVREGGPPVDGFPEPALANAGVDKDGSIGLTFALAIRLSRPVAGPARLQNRA